MKKNIAIGALATLLILAIISIAGLFYERSQNTSEIAELEEQVIELESLQETQESTGNVTGDVVNKTNFVNEAFSQYLNYTTDTYVERYQDMQNYFTDEVINKLQGAGSPSTPSVQVQSSTEDFKTYISPNQENQFVYVAQINYQLEDSNESQFTNVYLVDLIENDGEYLIENVDVYSGTPTNQ